MAQALLRGRLRRLKLSALWRSADGYGLNELIPFGDWRGKLEAAEKAGQDSSTQRQAILVEAFAQSLKQLGNYTYVAETTVQRPDKDRPLYCLFYATRHPEGISVFRDSQAEALKAESKTRAATKIKRSTKSTGQGEIFQSLHEMAPDPLVALLKRERTEAEQTLMDLVPKAPKSIKYSELQSQVLARHVVRYTDVNKIAGILYRNGTLLIPDWEPRKQVPQPNYRIQKPK